MPAVLITGANRGIGLEFARQYTADGWAVFAACRDPEAAKKLAALANGSGGKLIMLPMDVTDGGSVRRAARQLGNAAIDLLINNAGISGVPG
jgi:NAD(P)-dependent dehydrogenase (short-subunit alcohol dehydrogenase family)